MDIRESKHNVIVSYNFVALFNDPIPFLYYLFPSAPPNRYTRTEPMIYYVSHLFYSTLSRGNEPHSDVISGLRWTMNRDASKSGSSRQWYKRTYTCDMGPWVYCTMLWYIECLFKAWKCRAEKLTGSDLHPPPQDIFIRPFLCYCFIETSFVPSLSFDFQQKSTFVTNQKLFYSVYKSSFKTTNGNISKY